MRRSAKCLVDTNVPIVANLVQNPDPDSDVPVSCLLACIDAIERIVLARGLILDAGDEIYGEYVRNLSFSGRPGVGDHFMKWVRDNRSSLDAPQRVTITRNGDSYDEFPSHSGLGDFDRSDRKFVAVANSHADKPPILQATDSKWWGWKRALAECGIGVEFLCADYVE